MVIAKDVYERIVNRQTNAPPETGGILGGSSGVITNEHFDPGMQSERMCSYIPNVKTLNDVIKQWQQEGVLFMGIYHTHFWGVSTLSCGDTSYMERILRCMPSQIAYLYFPILVMPDRELVCYKASIKEDKLAVETESIRIQD